MVVRTGGYSAEYGRQLGGVIEVTSSRDAVPGLHGKVTVEGGSFADVNGSIDLQYQLGMNTSDPTGLSTDRYLGPTVQQNYTNHGSGAGVGRQLGAKLGLFRPFVDRGAARPRWVHGAQRKPAAGCRAAPGPHV